MKYYKLSPKNRLYKVDQSFLAKAPLLPNRYLWEKKGVQLALFQASETEDLYLASDYEPFLNQYLGYYQERFELSEIDGPPASAQQIFGFMDLAGASLDEV